MSNRREQNASQDLGSSLGASTAAAIDQMIRWPFWFTGASMDLMLQGMQRMTGQADRTMGSDGPQANGESTGGGPNRGSSSMNFSTSGSGSNWSAGWNTGANQTQSQTSASATASSGDDQDLSGDDLKYVLWSILFCKPGYETVLEPQQADIVNYSADGSSYAAVKIAKYLEKARHGRTERPQLWTEKAYPGDAPAGRRSEPTNIVGGNATATSSSQERGWRIPAEDHKYIKFVYRVERRLPKEEPDVTRIERVTIERGVESRTSVA